MAKHASLRSVSFSVSVILSHVYPWLCSTADAPGKHRDSNTPTMATRDRLRVGLRAARQRRGDVRDALLSRVLLYVRELAYSAHRPSR